MQREPVPPALPPELLNNDPNGYAWGVWHERTPKLVAEIRDAARYGPQQRHALDALLEEIAVGPMQPLDPGAHDHETWMSWGAGHFGKPWLDAPFLWSESYFFRRVLDAVGFFDPGPWHGVDPFQHQQAASVTMHVKPCPYYVSDATTADVVAALRQLTRTAGSAGEIADRLLARASEGRLGLYTHDFYCAPWSYRRMPDDLAATFEQVSLTIMKGISTTAASSVTATGPRPRRSLMPRRISPRRSPPSGRSSPTSSLVSTRSLSPA